MTSCVNPNPKLRCSRGRRCLPCMERDALPSNGLTKQNSSSIVATLFGLVRRGKR